MIAIIAVTVKFKNVDFYLNLAKWSDARMN
jgi:hypothetical protein